MGHRKQFSLVQQGGNQVADGLEDCSEIGGRGGRIVPISTGEESRDGPPQESF